MDHHLKFTKCNGPNPFFYYEDLINWQSQKSSGKLGTIIIHLQSIVIADLILIINLRCELHTHFPTYSATTS